VHVELHTSGRWRTFVAAASIVVSALVVYSNSFDVPFVGLDDKQSVRDNPHIRHLWPPSEALSLPLWRTSADDSEDKRAAVARRPVLSLSFALTHQLFGLEPAGHHAVNLAIHIAAALALFGIVRRSLVRCEVAAARGTWLALGAALVWLVHPLQTESVTYIIQRGETLVGLLVLLTLYCALRSFTGGARRLWEAGAVVACALGMGVKETPIIAPPLVLLYDWIFFSRSPVASLRDRRLLYGGLAATWMIPPLLAIGGSEDFNPGATLPYVLAQPRVVVHYLWLALWPDELFLYVNTRSYDVHSASEVIVPALVIAALAAATLWALVRRPALGFVGAWFFMTVAPASSIIALTDTIQEHRMYLPLAALAVLAMLAGESALKVALPRATGRTGRAAIAAGLVGALVLLLGLRSYARNSDYQREFAIVHPGDLHNAYTILVDHYLSRPELLRAEETNARAVLRHPAADPRDVVFAHLVLGFASQEQDRPEQAAQEFARVVEMDPTFVYARRQLGVMLREQGDLADSAAELESALRVDPASVYAHKELAVTLKEQGNDEDAERHLREALRIKPNFSEAHYELGLLALDREDHARALVRFRRALRYRPQFAEAHFELASLLEERGRHKRAAAHLEQAVRWEPGLAGARLKLARLLAARGDLEGAARQLRRAVRSRPGFAQAHTELAIVLRLRGRMRAAVAHLEKAIALEPQMAAPYKELGIVLRERKDLAGAGEQFEKAVALDPDYADAHNELGWVRLQQGELGAAAAEFERALAIRPDFAEARARLDQVEALSAGRESDDGAPGH
jgi:tetratricopeptide (TPR) repeat protein